MAFVVTNGDRRGRGFRKVAGRIDRLDRDRINATWSVPSFR
jgi:hypothetical protein